MLVNVHMPLDEFVPLACGKLDLNSNSVKFYYTCKFELSILVELNNDEELRKMFRFNVMHCRVYLSMNIEVEVPIKVLVEVIPKRWYINLHTTFIFTL